MGACSHARLVAQGYTQVPGFNFNSSFSPIIKASIVHIVLSLVVTQNGLYINWTSKMHFSVVFVLKEFSWSNH